MKHYLNCVEIVWCACACVVVVGMRQSAIIFGDYFLLHYTLCKHVLKSCTSLLENSEWNQLSLPSNKDYMIKILTVNTNNFPSLKSYFLVLGVTICYLLLWQFSLQMYVIFRCLLRSSCGQLLVGSPSSLRSPNLLLYYPTTGTSELVSLWHWIYGHPPPTLI